MTRRKNSPQFAGYFENSFTIEVCGKVQHSNPECRYAEACSPARCDQQVAPVPGRSTQGHPDSGIELDHQILILDRGRFPLSAFGSRFWPQATQNTKFMTDWIS